MSERGYPDYGAVKRISGMAAVLDLGEHAVRMGSFNALFRSGNVIFQDGFRHGLAPFKTVVSPSGGSVSIYAESALSFGECAKLTPQAIAGATAQLVRYLAPSVINRLGFEFAFAFPNADGQIVLSVHGDNNNGFSRTWAKLDSDGTYYQYNGATSSYDEIGTYKAVPGEKYHFGHFKLVIDYSTKKLVKGYLNAQSFDLSHLALKQDLSGVGKRIDIEFQAYDDTNNGHSTLIDNIIVTVNEP